MRIFSVVGRKNSGKTTLIERMIPFFKAKGLRVAVVKHDAHDFSIDHEGKDTWRVRKAGADEVIIASGSQMAHMRSLPAPMEVGELLSHLASVDVVILEGYKRLNFPKLVVLRDASELFDMRLDGDPSVTAYVLRRAPNAAPPDSAVPRFWADEVERIAEFSWKKAREMTDEDIPVKQQTIYPASSIHHRASSIEHPASAVGHRA
ncbi:molybdopterin-guanine dinucleotide biosynthesis protein B [bacterium]|nr:molybdopterin-guanine dinucleotide biosynthesis protein B [bacterium]